MAQLARVLALNALCSWMVIYWASNGLALIFSWKEGGTIYYFRESHVLNGNLEREGVLYLIQVLKNTLLLPNI